MADVLSRVSCSKDPVCGGGVGYGLYSLDVSSCSGPH